jgi:anaerobic ribonucleoside-triphosphate reductase activating protein
MQASSLLSFARQVREAGLGLWIYTGWTVEEIVLRGDPYEITLLGYADAIVDGRFEANKKTLEIPFVGSANQRIITAEEIRFFMERARLDRSARNFTAPAPDRE